MCIGGAPLVAGHALKLRDRLVPMAEFKSGQRLVALENGYTDIVPLLLVNQAGINGKIRDGLTPLHLAAVWRFKDFVKLLLANKAEINPRNTSGKTPLGMARSNHYEEVVELLRQSGGSG